MSDLLLVFSNAVPGQDAAFNSWYDNQHLSDVLAVPGVVAAQRYTLVTPAQGAELPTAAAPQHSYLATYELDGDPDAVLAEFVNQTGTGRIRLDPSLDLSTVSMALWRSHGERQSAR